MGEHDALRLARCARCGDDQGVALLDGEASAQCVLLAVGTDDPRGAEGVEHRVARDEGEPGVERSGGVAGVPDGLECIDETHATREVECDELRHRPVA